MSNNFILFSALILVAPGIVIGEEQDGAPAVMVKINPFISRSKRIIQFSGDGRFKRNGPEKSAVFLEFPESFFEDPKLKRLYRALIGDGSRKSEKLKPENTEIVFQIDPAAFGQQTARVPKKRDVRDEMAAFQLTIAPAAAHVKQMGRGLVGFVPRHETTKNWCMEKELQPDTESDVDDQGVVPTDSESSSELVSETMCYPSKPSLPKLRICGGKATEAQTVSVPHDPCHPLAFTQSNQPEVETTPYDVYTQCKSTDAVVTHHVDAICFTTEKCSPKATFVPYAVDIFSTTYKPILKPSCLPSSTACATHVFQRHRRRRQKSSPLKNFFVLSNSPQSCPPFCPPGCTSSKPKDCSSSTTVADCCSTTASCDCSTATTTECSCPSTNPSTTCSCPNTNTSTTCSTTSTKNCCPKVKRARGDDPLRNVLRLFRHQRHPVRVRRNPPPSKRRPRTLFVYRPKRGLRKVRFRQKNYLQEALK